MAIRIDMWSVCFAIHDPWLAPELKGQALHGFVNDHPLFKESSPKRVTTSPITKIDGRKIVTASGTVYILGRIEPKYRKWLRECRPAWDWRKPITLIGDDNGTDTEETD